MYKKRKQVPVPNHDAPWKTSFYSLFKDDTNVVLFSVKNFRDVILGEASL